MEAEPQYQRTEKDNATLAKIMLSDPRLDKKRIEATKGGLLRDSYRWVLESHEFKAWKRDKGPLWVRGDPGKGKTMLLCGIIDELQEISAYFFCQATNEAINTGTAVLRGLIYVLADENPALIPLISKRLNKSNNIFDTNSWYMLSQILEDMITQDTYIIIDALDECIESRQELLRFIILNRDKATWVVSSRNWPEIEDVLRRAPFLSLETNTASVSQAIEHYIQFKANELADAKDFHKDTKDIVLAYLQQHANGTFLWVALVCANLAKVRQRHVKTTMQQFPSDLNAVYHRMWQMVEDNDDAEILQRILAICTLAVWPLALNELKTILELPEDSTTFLKEVIQDYGSFLSINKADVIEFVHQSAKEYVDKRNCVAPKPLHKEIFSCSMAALFRVLRRDIYKLENPATSIVKLQQSELRSDPLADVQYACIYWAHHLVKCGELCLWQQTLLRRFLTYHYLPWLEAMSLLRSTAAALIAMHDLEALTERICVAGNNHNDLEEAGDISLRALFYDARRFIQHFRDIVETFPLQVYYSGLLFSPENSMVRKAFSEEAPQSVQIVRYLSTEWPPILTMFDIRPDTTRAPVTALSFSDDSEQIVVGYKDGLMQIWYLKSMVLMHSTRLPAISDEVYDCWVQSVFLLHTQKVLCQRHSGIASVWDLATKQMSDLDMTEVVSISRYGMIAFKENSTSVRFLNATETRCQDEACLELDLFTEPRRDNYASATALSLVFATDAKIIAARTAADIVEIWSIEPLYLYVTVSTERHRHHTMAINSKYLSICESSKDESPELAGSYEEKPMILNLYDLGNGSLISTFSVGSDHFSYYFQIEISQNGRYIAFTNCQSSVFDIASGTCVWQSPASRYSWLSPNLRYIVSLAGELEPEASFTLRESFTAASAIAMKDSADTQLAQISSDGRRILLYMSSGSNNDKVVEVDSDRVIWQSKTAFGWQLSADMTLAMIENLAGSSCRICQLLPHSLEMILELNDLVKSGPRNRTPYTNFAFAPNNSHAAVVKRGRRVMIYHLMTGKELLSIDCRMSVIALSWSPDSNRIVVAGRRGLILIDVDSKQELLRDHNAIWMGFSEDGMSLMMWHAELSHSEKDVATSQIALFHRESYHTQCVPDDETEYEQLDQEDHFEERGSFPRTVWIGHHGQPADDDVDEEEEDESKKQLPPLGNFKVQAGKWTEWNIIKSHGRRLEHFHPKLFLARFYFNSRFLVIAEASGRHWFYSSLKIRVWDRVSGRQMKPLQYPDYHPPLRIQGNTLHTARGIMTIEPDSIRLGSRMNTSSTGNGCG